VLQSGVAVLQRCSGALFVAHACTLQKHRATVSSLTFSADGLWLACTPRTQTHTRPAVDCPKLRCAQSSIRAPRARGRLRVPVPPQLRRRMALRRCSPRAAARWSSARRTSMRAFDACCDCAPAVSRCPLDVRAPRPFE
jgi:hypothetical protein